MKLPPMVPLRALREAHGLTAADLAARIGEFGVPIHPDSIISFELGHKPASKKLRVAWAAALGIKVLDVRGPAEIRELIGQVDGDAADEDTEVA